MISSTYTFNPTLIEIPRNLSKKTDNVLAENYHLIYFSNSPLSINLVYL